MVGLWVLNRKEREGKRGRERGRGLRGKMVDVVSNGGERALVR